MRSSIPAYNNDYADADYDTHYVSFYMYICRWFQQPAVKKNCCIVVAALFLVCLGTCKFCNLVPIALAPSPSLVVLLWGKDLSSSCRTLAVFSTILIRCYSTYR